MLGLAHRGFTLNDYNQHIIHTLRKAGYYTALIGEEHLSKDPNASGYDQVSRVEGYRAELVAPAAVELLNHGLPQPFFLSVGFFETHREFLKPSSIEDIKYSLPPAPLPDTPETRRDMGGFKASAWTLVNRRARYELNVGSISGDLITIWDLCCLIVMIAQASKC